jgi:hypothetical protein
LQQTEFDFRSQALEVQQIAGRRFSPARGVGVVGEQVRAKQETGLKTSAVNL